MNSATSKLTTGVACALAISFSALAADAPKAKALESDKVLFPHSGAYELFQKGLAKAENFRRGLLKKSTPAATQTRGEALADTMLRFREEANAKLKDGITLTAFEIDSKFITTALHQPKLKPRPEVFESFEGAWFGKWDQMEVDHRWSKVRRYDPPQSFGVPNVLVHALQYAWIGDGFGWNVIASAAKTPQHTFILGTVYHIADGDVTKVRLHRPHVGIDCGGGKLIWMTRGEVFFEEALGDNESTPDRYAITGFNYRWREGSPTWRTPFFQAIYTRDPQDRPAWRKF